MKRNNKLFFASVLLLLLGIISCFSLSRTYAKYATSITGEDTARVAKWSWNINGADLTKTQTSYVMDLFSKSKLLDSDCTASESDVSSSDKVIAPGTCGKFDIEIINNSEVNATYAYTLTATNAGNIPLEYSTDKTTWGDLSTVNKTATAIAPGEANVQKVTVYWRWKFDGVDATDTALGYDGTATVKLSAKLDLTQVD